MTLFEHTCVQSDEEAALRRLFNAFETSRKRHLVDDYDQDLILSGDGANLSAVNRSARLCWAHFLCDELANHFKYSDVHRSINQPVFLFTLVDISCAIPSDEFQVDLAPMVQRLRKGLRHRDYIGVIEPGLYSHIATVGTNLNRSQCVSWHLHALVWGMDAKDVKRLATKLNRAKKYVPIAPDQSGVDARRVCDGEFAETLAYLLKRPKKAYRLAQRIDPDVAGEVTHRQYSSLLRPGEHLTAYLQMKHLSLFDTWVASGEGCTILETTKRRYHAAVRLHKRLTRGRGRIVGRKRDLFRICR